MPTSSWGSALAGAYVVTVAAMAFAAWSQQQDGFSWLEAGSLVLALPALVVLFPAVYLIGGLVNGQIGDSDLWLLGLTFALTLGACAAANVWLWTLATRRWVERRQRRQLGPIPREG